MAATDEATHAVLAAVILAGSLACSHRTPEKAPITVMRDRPAGSSFRAAAVVAFGKGESDDIFYAVRDVRPIPWSLAPTMRVVKVNGMTSMSLSTQATAKEAPLVVVLRSMQPGAVEASIFAVGGSAVDSVESAVAVRPCLGENWISAFFVEGLGPAPTRPVHLRFKSGEFESHLMVDPRQHTVRGAPALRLAGEDVDGGAARPERRTVNFQPSADLKPVMPIAVWRDTTRWGAFGGTGGSRSMIIGEYATRSPIQEWWFYVFEAPPVC